MLHPILTRTLRDVRVAVSPVVVLDLDGTLLDNRPRTVEVMRRYRARHPTLPAVELHDVRETLGETLVGVGASVNDVVGASVYWVESFFSGELLHADRAAPGAVHYARVCVSEGARIVYLSGRDEVVVRETGESLRQLGFPDGELRLKPRGVSDVEHKRAALERMRGVVALIDNEPAVCNAARSILRDAHVLRIDTECLPGAPPLVERVELLPGFLETAHVRVAQ